MLRTVFSLLLALSVWGAAAARAQSITPDCGAVGWLSALRHAHGIEDALLRRDRLARLFALVEPDAMLDRLTKGLSGYDADVLARFLTVSRRSPYTLTPRMERQLAGIAMPVHCRGLSVGSAHTPKAADPPSRQSDGLERAPQVSRPIQAQIRSSALWAIPFIAGAGLVALRRRMVRARRRAKRHPCALPIAVVVGRTEIPGRFVDLSQTGGKIRLRHPVEADRTTNVRIELPDGSVTATAIWSNGDTLGVAFAKPFGRLRLHKLLALSKMRTARSDKGSRRPASS